MLHEAEENEGKKRNPKPKKQSVIEVRSTGEVKFQPG